MRRATITEAKNGLSALIDQVRAGETVLITDRGVPVARLEPAVSIDEPGDDRLARLERAGLARRGHGDLGPFLDRRPVSMLDGSSIVDVLLEEREEGW